MTDVGNGSRASANGERERIANTLDDEGNRLLSRSRLRIRLSITSNLSNTRPIKNLNLIVELRDKCGHES